MRISSLHHKNISLKNIKIATPSKSYQQRKEKVRMGILIHDILAKIFYKKDTEKVLENQLLSGNITQNERKIISEKINEILNNPKYAPYFNEHTEEILNEREILLSTENGEQEIYRPDRIVRTKEGYIIIDFKTGKEEEKKHQQQIKTYQNALEKLGKKVVKSEIIYLD